MIYFIVTASVYNNCETRKNQYINGVCQLKKVIKLLNIENYKIIIVDNNGLRNTFLNTLDCEVYYTNNNLLPTTNKGCKEFQDVSDCIDKYNIKNTDFIVKLTGRYILEDNSEFMNIIKNIHDTKYECVIKYGSYNNPANYKMDDCITGLIGMSCFYIKQIEKPKEDECIEWKWAKVTKLIDDEKICLVNKLGINICPGSDFYFLM